MTQRWNWLKKTRYRALANVEEESGQHFFRHPNKIKLHMINNLEENEKKMLEVYTTTINSGQLLSAEDLKDFNNMTLRMVLKEIGLN